MNTKGLLIFDLDGTLFKSELVTLPAVAASFTKFGLEPPPDSDVLDHIGKPMTELEQWLAQRHGKELGCRMVRSIGELEDRYIHTHGRLYEGAYDAVSELKSKGYSTAICTNGGHEYVTAVVESTGIGDLFDTVRHLETDSDTKPRMAAELLDRFGTRMGVVTGDRAADIDAAHANGLKAVGAAYGFGGPDELAEADELVQSPADIPSVVERLIE